jgi:nucleotide-binding universal stress UspA family protein
MNILVCYDGSNVAKDALELGMEKAKKRDGTLHVVYSMKGGMEVPRRDFEIAEKMLNQVKIKLDAAKIASETHFSVRGLEPGEDIVQLAKEQDIDEIIIGVKRRSKVGKLLFGSTAQFVILEAHCPVLTVK